MTPDTTRHLVAAYLLGDAALGPIGDAWAADAEVRTPRLADALSLLERGLAKLLAEAGRRRPRQSDAEHQAALAFVAVAKGQREARRAAAAAPSPPPPPEDAP